MTEPSTRPQRKLRVVCFHGFGTNGEMMKAQMRHLSRLMEPYAELVFPNGPNVVSKSLVVDPAVHKFIGEALSYSWFNYRNLSGPQLIQASINYIEKLSAEEGPFDGMIGFSQGGAFVHLIILAIKLGLIKSDAIKNMRFAILICTAAWKWNDIELKTEVHPLDFPTLHLVSKSDFLYMASMASTVKFVRPQIMHHGQGHKIPRISLEDFQDLMKFVNKAMIQPRPFTKSPQARL